MIGRIVITSVPRGLDGGTGFQPVLRTRGLRPSIAQRLAMRSAYPHPYPVGDPRNPHVVFHRIELVDGQTIHVLGSVRDAGASYTGRSSYLADLIAIDQAETGSLLGGPAYAAQSFPWIRAWTGEPRETPLAQEPAVAARDADDPVATGRPAACPAWQRATGDAGWAGELAKSFVDGRRALIWAGAGSNVLELFAEALRLLPVQVRWQVTFNTCEIEAFPSHWRAVRPDLGLVGNYDPKNELRLVLGKLREAGSRAPDHEFSRRARGELIGAASPSSEAQARVVESGNPSGPPPPSGRAPADTATNDAVLREQLRHIRESRQRRSGIAPTTDTDPGPHRPRVALISMLLLGLLLVSAVAAVAIGTAAMRNPELFQGSSGVLLASRTRRARPNEAVQSTPPATAVEESLTPVDSAPRQSDSPTSPQTAAAPQPTAAPSQDSPTQEKQARARGSSEALELLPRFLIATGTNTTSQPAGTGIDPTVASPPAVRYELAVGFAAEDFDPPLQLRLFSPFAPTDATHSYRRLRLEKKQKQPGAWVITGLPPKGQVSPELSAHIDLCNVTITSGTLHITANSHDHYTCLQNSLLVLSAQHPDDAKRRIERTLLFAAPITSATATISIFATATSTPFSAIEDRVHKIPADMVSYVLECSHPSWGETKSVRKDIRSQAHGLSVVCPTTGVTIEYHDAPSTPHPRSPAWACRKGVLQITGTLTFQDTDTQDPPFTVNFTPSVVDQLSELTRVKTTITNLQWLADLNQQSKKKLTKGFPDKQDLNKAKSPEGFRSLNNKSDQHFIQHGFEEFARTKKYPDPSDHKNLEAPKVYYGDLTGQGINPNIRRDKEKPIKTLNDFWDAQFTLNLLWKNTKIVNAPYDEPDGVRRTYKDSKEFNSREQAYTDCQNRLHTIYNDFVNFLDMACDKDCGDIVNRLLQASNAHAFDPITITITDLRVAVFSDQGEERHVPVVGRIRR